MNKRVFVSGCYDLLHSGHVAFFKEASKYGDLYVGIGSDKTIEQLKGRPTIKSEAERLYMVKAVRFVKDAIINSGTGIIDFEEELVRLKPHYLVVNEDGNSPAKKMLCDKLGIELKVLERIPDAGLPPRSNTAIRSSGVCTLPYRIDLAGTWIDQPYVSKFHPGWAINLSSSLEKGDKGRLIPEIRNTHINIGTGEEISIKELAELIKQTVGFSGKLIFNTSKPDGTMRKLTDVAKLHALGWHHEIDIAKGVKKLYKWYIDFQQ